MRLDPRRGIQDTWVLETPPSVQIAGPGSPPHAGDSVTERVEVSGGASPVDLTWSFGDVANGSGLSVTHRYEHHGSYSITVRLVDWAGAVAMANGTLEVTMPPPNPLGYWTGGGFLGSPYFWVVAVAGVAITVGTIVARRRDRVRRRPPGILPASTATPTPEESKPS